LNALAGQTVSCAVQATPRNGPFDSAISFSCSGLPRGCTASFSPATVTPGASSATTSLTITTTARSGSLTSAGVRSDGFVPPALGLILVVLIFFAALAAPAIFRRPDRVRPGLRRLETAVLILLMVWLAACGAGGNGGPAKQGTPAGTYQLLIQGYSRSLTFMSYLTLVVQ
jgi:hypothetical protein